MTPCARLLASATSVWGYLMDKFEPTNVRHVPNLKKNLLSLGALQAWGYKFRSRWRNQSYQRLYDNSQRRTDSKRVQVDMKYYCWWCFSSNREGGYYKILAHVFCTHDERGLQAIYKRSALPSITYCKLDLYKICIMGRQRRVAFSTSQHKIKSLLDLIHTDVCGGLRQ